VGAPGATATTTGEEDLTLRSVRKLLRLRGRPQDVMSWEERIPASSAPSLGAGKRKSRDPGTKSKGSLPAAGFRPDTPRLPPGCSAVGPAGFPVEPGPSLIPRSLPTLAQLGCPPRTQSGARSRLKAGLGGSSPASSSRRRWARKRRPRREEWLPVREHRDRGERTQAIEA
jgi:hypothetical protein